ncbi:hypothetical protein [Mesobacillus selenatarsenatis]|uniref:Uncharacterized protein n=1 Tax=Mesobacillus selenatarsenatis (strain DSM 18680 / JCM 14380 / FERM P-15431 / SF-1) TaxID=1321606 RepID=A0A0A8X2Y5_MESS1|nr:hypothetical protein [Mesobacillus selenatarsenatis]GAM12481.1 hypothetical protein SAMD00020551_0616 [Mesobacillus selenatarsenatis SF-1]
MRAVDIETKKLKELRLEMPDLDSSNFVMKAIDYSVNGWTVGLLYTVLLMFITVYVKHKKVFLPSLISLAIGLLTLAASFVVAVTVDPWAGIGVGMLAAGLLVCTIVIFIFAFVMKLLRKGAR